MGEAGGQRTEKDVLAVFEGLDDPGEPLTTEEVADALGRPRSAVSDALGSLVERGELQSKRLGAAVSAWWRPSSVAGRTGSHPGDDSAAVSSGQRDFVERILGVSPVSIVVVEPSGRVSFANDRAVEVLGLEFDEITSRTYRHPGWNIYYEDGTSVPVEEHPVTRVLETRQPAYGFEHWIELPDGTVRWLSSNSAPVLNDADEVEYVVVGFEDATSMKEREDKLTTDRQRLVELQSERLFRPFVVAAEGEFRIEMDELVRLPDGKALQYITATGISAKALVDVFERDAAVRDVRLLRSTDDRCRVEVRVEGPSVSSMFDDLDGRATSLVQRRTDDAPVLTGELPGDVDPREATRELRQLFPDVELTSQELRYTPRLLYHIVEDSLTDRQFAALRAAYYGEYFETPRTSTGDDLAEQLGVTRQTFNQHLRKAEQSVLTQLFEASGKAAR
jgi:PAS domain S-box-containing protein